MITKTGKKVFFVNPPNILNKSYLEHIYKSEYELYLLENTDNIERLFDMFDKAVLFINIDKLLTHSKWIDYIAKIHDKYKDIIITVFTNSDKSSLRKTLLYDIGIRGGVINLQEDNWKSIKIIERALELNEAQERRKFVRLNFDNNKPVATVSVKIYTKKGYQITGKIKSLSSAGLFTHVNNNGLVSDDSVENILFSINNHNLNIHGELFKRTENGDYYISFNGISEQDKDVIQTFIFESLQMCFKELLEKLGKTRTLSNQFS